MYAHYLYDAGGNRVEKYTRTAGGNWETITYIDGLIEYREDQDGKIQSINHVMDDSRRIATIREGSDFGDTTPAIKYNLDDHLGSSNVLVDENGTLVNFEEYYPFGETSFGSYEKKRYRFCGKEKDEESGMYYYGARYYSPWLCRFISVDPLAGKYPFYTPYQYAGNKPIISVDIDGLEGNNDTGQQQTASGPVKENVFPAAEGGFINIPINAVVNTFKTDKIRLANKNLEISINPNSVRDFTLPDGSRYVAAFNTESGDFLGYKNFQTGEFYKVSGLLKDNFYTHLFNVEGEKFTKFSKTKNHASDPATKFGVTIGVFKKYAQSFKLKPTEDSLKSITIEQALTITLNEFWNTKAINFESLLVKSKDLTKVVFETYFNAPQRTKERFKLAVQDTDFNSSGTPSNPTIRIVFSRFVDSMDSFYENSSKAKNGFGGLKTKMDKYRNDSLYLNR